MPSPPAAGKRRRGVVALLALNLIVSATALVMALIVLARQPAVVEQKNDVSSAAELERPDAPDAAGRKVACDAWTTASKAMVAARQAFLDSPSSWSDPATASSLTQAQAGILIQAEYLRQHVPATTPAEVAAPIAEYIAASIDVAALDGQHQEAAVANAAADRTGAAAAKVRAACGAS